jgi:hypothetical protein
MKDHRIRYDRHGRPEYTPSTSPTTVRALAILQATKDRDDRKVQTELKARQDAGQLNPQERMFYAIFGDIK